MPDNFRWREWRVVVKLDPEKQITDERLSAILHKQVDAVIVGGTQGITGENTARLIEQVSKLGYKGTLVQEISESHAVFPGADGYIIPVVLNAADREWLVGAHMEAIKKYRDVIDWQRILPVGYIVCNPLSAVGMKTWALPVSAAEVAAYTVLAMRIFSMPAVYIEYSGTYGDPAFVRAAASAVAAAVTATDAAAAGPRVFYGGGLNTAARLQEMSNLADTVVIGNALYEERDLQWL